MRDARSWSRKHQLACLLIGLIGVAGTWCGCARNPQAVATHRELLRELEEDAGEPAPRPDPHHRRSRLTAKIGTTRPEKDRSEDPFLREAEEIARAETDARAPTSNSGAPKPGSPQPSTDSTDTEEGEKLRVAGAERAAATREPRRETQSPARLKADTLMFRARSALSQDRLADAIRLAREAQRIEQSERLAYRPGEERPSQFLARVERIVAGQDTLDDLAAAAAPVVKSVQEAVERAAESQVADLPSPGNEVAAAETPDVFEKLTPRKESIKKDELPFIEDTAADDVVLTDVAHPTEMAAEADDDADEELDDDEAPELEVRDDGPAVTPEGMTSGPGFSLPAAANPLAPAQRNSDPKKERAAEPTAEPKAKPAARSKTPVAPPREVVVPQPQGPKLGGPQVPAPVAASGAKSTAKSADAADSTPKPASRAVPMQLPRNIAEGAVEKLSPAPLDRSPVERIPHRGSVDRGTAPSGTGSAVSLPTSLHPQTPVQPYSAREPLRPLPAAPPIPQEERELSPHPPSSPHSTSPGVGSPANPSKLERRALDSRAIATDGQGAKVAEVAVNSPRSLTAATSLIPVSGGPASELPAISAAKPINAEHETDDGVAKARVAPEADPRSPRREAGIVITPGPVMNSPDPAPTVPRGEKPRGRKAKRVGTEKTQVDAVPASKSPVHDADVSESDDAHSEPQTLETTPEITEPPVEPEQDAEAAVPATLGSLIEAPMFTSESTTETAGEGEQLARANQAARVAVPAPDNEVMAAPALTSPSAAHEEAAPAPPAPATPLATMEPRAPMGSAGDEDPELRRPRWTRLSQVGLIVGLLGMFGLGLYRRMERTEFQTRQLSRGDDSAE